MKGQSSNPALRFFARTLGKGWLRVGRKTLFIPEDQRRYRNGAMLCGANGNTCLGLACVARGLHVCTGHGGQTKLGQGMKHGKYSKIFKGDKLKRYEKYLRDPNRRDNLEAMAVLQHMIDDDVSGLVDNTRMWQSARESFNEFKRTMSERAPKGLSTDELEQWNNDRGIRMNAALAELQVALNTGGTDDNLRDRLSRNLDLQTKILEREVNETVKTKQVFYMEEVMNLIARNRELILRYVPDERKPEFETEYSRAMGVRELGLVG